MYALFEIGGKQYKAEKEKLVQVDLVDKEVGEEISFDSVLLLSDNENVKIGTPYVKGGQVKAVVEDHIKDKKVIIYKFKRRKSYRRKQGHRQQYSVLKIKDIVGA